jgi:hypothetical protein
VTYEKKKISPVTVVAGMAAAILSMFLGSLFGTQGTFLGAAIGSCVVGVGGTLFENTIRRAHYVTRNGIQVNRRARSTALILAMTVGMIGLCALTAFGTMSAIEAVTGRTVHSVTTGNPQYGNSWDYATAPAPSYAPSPGFTPSPSLSPSFTPSLSPSPSLSSSPPPSPSSPPPSPSLTESPGASPDYLPSGTGISTP